MNRNEFIIKYGITDISDLKLYLKEEIGQYLNWMYSEGLKELETTNSFTKAGQSSLYSIEKSIDKYLERL